MKKLLLTIITAVSCFYANSQVLFNETFDGIAGPTAGGAGTYSFPSGWFLANADNATPAGAVSYVNEGWERREDFAFNVTDSAAFSTSWYSPAGTANDWMVTPAIGPLPANTILSWNAVAYDPDYRDGYEVRIMTTAPTGGAGNIGNLLTSSTLLQSIAAEYTAWTSRTQDLSAYAGQTVYIAFRNNSFDKFLLLIDDVKLEASVQFDAILESTNAPAEYTMTPKAQLTPLTTSAMVKNNGGSALSNTALKLTIYDEAMTSVFTTTGLTTSSIAPGATVQLDSVNYNVPAIPGMYTLEFVVTHGNTDENTSNDSIITTLIVTDSTYARDNGTITGGLGIGAGNGGFLGQQFTIYNNSLATSITQHVTTGYTGEKTACVIYDMVNGEPNAIVAYTDTLFYADDSARTMTLPVQNGGHLLTPGDYLVASIEFDSTLQLGQCSGVFTMGTTWVYWPTTPFGAWANLENFGAGFQKSFSLRLNLNPDCSGFTASTLSTGITCVTCTDGSIATTTNGTAPYSYNWSHGTTGDIATGLAPGIYAVTITDNAGCSVTLTDSISSYDCSGLDVTVSGNDITCVTCTNGIAIATATGGVAPYTYSWSPVSVQTDTASALSPGIYTVTTIDNAGCWDTASVTINGITCAGFSLNTIATDATCPTCATGSAFAIATGGVSPYTYNWSPSGGTLAASQNLTPGSYTVTVTDALGCTETETATVGIATGISEINADEISIYPNPASGICTISIPSYLNDAVLTVRNDLGQIVFTQLLNDNFKITFDTHQLASGNYNVMITSKQQVINKRLSVNK